MIPTGLPDAMSSVAALLGGTFFIPAFHVIIQSTRERTEARFSA